MLTLMAILGVTAPALADPIYPDCDPTQVQLCGPTLDRPVPYQPIEDWRRTDEQAIDEREDRWDLSEPLTEYGSIEWVWPGERSDYGLRAGHPRNAYRSVSHRPRPIETQQSNPLNETTDYIEAPQEFDFLTIPVLFPENVLYDDEDQP